MRVNENGEMKTLEQDIDEIWKGHGLKVTEITYSGKKGSVWTIKAKPDKKIS